MASQIACAESTERNDLYRVRQQFLMNRFGVYVGNAHGSCLNQPIRLCNTSSKALAVSSKSWLTRDRRVGLVVARLPFLIYRGYGHFRFEGTWADVSCFFTEGYGLMFPIVVAPLLALATFAQKLAFLKFTKIKPAFGSSPD